MHPGRPVHPVAAPGCRQLVSYWKHWPCLFPQHDLGRKHLRRLELAGWQQEILASHPGPFVRGLFLSDGCRKTNRISRQVGGETRHYEYPRYFFTNESADILRWCGQALDRLGVAWRLARRTNLSVARREAVEALDRIVGPKY